MVTDLGFAVPSGKHSLIAVRSSQLLNEKPPIGKCGEKDLQNYDSYSWFRCQRDCEIALLERECGCKAMYMPLNKNETENVCNMTHYFTCALNELRSFDDSKSDSLCRSLCMEPCTRTIFEPQSSSAALSSLSIESILRTNFETLQKNYRKAIDLQHRIQENVFIDTAENLLDVKTRYKRFLKSVNQKVSNFESRTLQPVVEAVKELIRIFEHDMNEVVFKGLNSAMFEIDMVFGPDKDSMDFFVLTVVKNCKLVTLHVKNLIRLSFKYPSLDDLINATVEYSTALQESLPRYYTMVTDVPDTMRALGFNFDIFLFPPERLAHESDICQEKVFKFNNVTAEITADLKELQEKVNAPRSGEDNEEIRHVLKELYIDLFEYEANFEKLKDDCFDEFIDAVKEVREFNETYHEEVVENTDLDYTFDFAVESEDIVNEQKTYSDLLKQYFEDKTISKFKLEKKLSEDWLNELMDTPIILIEKVKFRLTERLRSNLDETRRDMTDWYQDVLRRAAAMKEFMLPNFIEERIKTMRIWKGPQAVIDPVSIQESYIVDTSEWTLNDYMSSSALQYLDAIVDQAFDKIKSLLDALDEELTDLEQELFSALQQVRNLMDLYRDQDRIDERYVLKNFLQMDVYYSELRTQKIIQMPAYTIEDLFSDVGGYMGLLLGASAVTVFEILDLIIYNLLLKIFCKVKVPKSQSELKNFSDRSNSVFVYDQVNPDDLMNMKTF